MSGVARFGGTGLWAVPAAMLVAFGLFLAVPDDYGLSGSAVPYTETNLVPEVSHVFSSTGTIDPRSEPAEYVQRGIGVSDEVVASSVQNTAIYPAAFADAHAVAYTGHYLPYYGVCAFDDDGNLYGGRENYVFRADVSDKVATKWIIPSDESFQGCGDADSSGKFYFISDRELWRLNPTDNSFTNYSLDYSLNTSSPIVVDPSDDVYLYQPSYVYVIEGSRQAKVFVSFLNLSVQYDPDDDFYQCSSKCHNVLDACDDACDDAQDACDQTCNDSESCLDACNETRNQCADTCYIEKNACEIECYAGPGRIDENDSVHNLIQFSGSGVSGPATVSVLSSDSSVLGTTSVLPDRHGTVYGSIQIPTDIASGTYDLGSGVWNTPPGPYSTTGRHTLVLQDLSQTASTEFELAPDRIITPEPETLDRHSAETHFHRALVAKLNADRLTTFYGDISNSRYHVVSLDPSGHLYLQGGGFIARFDPVSSELKEWYVGSVNSYASLGAYGEKVYYAQSLQYRTMLAELDMEENTLRKWTMPHHRSPSSIAVDSQGNVFLAFDGGSWLKFVPSTGTFTEFYNPSPVHFEIGPQDVLYWASYRSGGTIR